MLLGEKNKPQTKFQGARVVLLVSCGEGVGGFGRLEVSSIEYDFGTVDCRALHVSAPLPPGRDRDELDHLIAPDEDGCCCLGRLR